MTRDYLLDLDWPAAEPPQGGRAPSKGRDAAPRGQDRPAPLLTVWGGKITTFRRLAEEAADLLAAPLGIRPDAWTQGASLPGGDLSAWIGKPERPDIDFGKFVEAVARRHPALPAALCRRLARGYGSRIESLLGEEGLGVEVAPGLFEAELRYLHDHEWARSADDVLWRRTKLGLHFTPAERAAVAAWCAAHWPDAARPRAAQQAVAQHAGGAWN